MKEIIVVVLVTVLALAVAFKTKKIENFDTGSMVSSTVVDTRRYTHPTPNQTLRNPNQPPANYFRPSNTFLVPSEIFEDDIDRLDLPEKFQDKYTEWIDKGFLPIAQDQMSCGGCWAFATASSLGTRFMIATNGKWDAPWGLSDQYLISCGGKLGMQQWQGCQGGIPQYAIDALQNGGIPKDKKDLNTKNKYTYFQTLPDENSSCSLTPSSTCPCDKLDEYFGEERFKTVGESHTYTAHTKDEKIKHDLDLWPNIPQDVIDDNVHRMKKAIYFEGPFTVGIRVTEDFYKFKPTKDNYYKYDGRSQMLGGHAVIIVGWKKLKDGTPVWICKNSWGDNWGYGYPHGPKWNNLVSGTIEPKYKGGFWNNIMGINDQFIESNAVGSHPDLTHPDIAKHLPDNGKNIPKEWFKTMTLRDIYENHIDEKKKPDRTIKKIQKEFTLDEKNLTITVNPVKKVTSQMVNAFFDNPTTKYIIGGSEDTFHALMDHLPDYDVEINSDTMSDIIDDIEDNITDYVILGIKGSNSVKYWLIGDTTEWNPFNLSNFAGRTVDPKIATGILYEQIKILGVNDKVYIAKKYDSSNDENSSENENFTIGKSNRNTMVHCPITGRRNCRMGCCEGQYKPYFYDNAKMGLSCGPSGSCNQKDMQPWLWGQSVQSYQTAYPVTTIGYENKVCGGSLSTMPTAYGAFMIYDHNDWERGKRSKLESANWRWVNGRNLGPGTLV
jgi:hypothetical protein